MLDWAILSQLSVTVTPFHLPRNFHSFLLSYFSVREDQKMSQAQSCGISEAVESYYFEYDLRLVEF